MKTTFNLDLWGGNLPPSAPGSLHKGPGRRQLASFTRSHSLCACRPHSGWQGHSFTGIGAGHACSECLNASSLIGEKLLENTWRRKLLTHYPDLPSAVCTCLSCSHTRSVNTSETAQPSPLLFLPWVVCLLIAHKPGESRIHRLFCELQEHYSAVVTVSPKHYFTMDLHLQNTRTNT